MSAICDCKIVKSSPHFHYDIVELKDVQIALSNFTHTQCPNNNGQERSSQHVEIEIEVKLRTGAPCSAKRTFADLRLLDYHLHECAFGRSFSRLANLSEWRYKDDADLTLLSDELREYINRLSVLISNRVTCCTLFEFLELESHGLRKQGKTDLGKAEEELNVPALTAVRCIQAHVATDSDELPLNVGDIVAVIDMPDASESIWWKGKCVTAEGCFKVGYFPYYCIELFAARSLPSHPVLADTTNQQTLSPMPAASGTQMANQSIGSQQKKPVALRAKKSVLLKRGKLGALLRAFFATRPSRTALKQRGLLRDRVFGCDLSEYLLRLGRATPPILELCGALIESIGVLAGVYRLSGPQSVVQRLRARFDDDQYLLAKLAEFENERQAANDVSSSQPSHHADTSTLETSERVKPDEPLSLMLQTGMDVSATSILRPLDEHQRATRLSSESDTSTSVLNADQQASRADAEPSPGEQQQSQLQPGTEREVGIDVPTGDSAIPAAPTTEVSTSFRAPWYEDTYSLAAVLRMYFRELPNPLFTFELYDELLALLAPILSLRTAAEDSPQASAGFAEVLDRARQTLAKLPHTHYRTAHALFTHLQHMAHFEAQTNMGARNLSIVWSPNLLYRRALALRPNTYDPSSLGSASKPVKLKTDRAVDTIQSPHDALSEARDLTAVTEFFIRYSHLLFDDDPPVSAPTPTPMSMNCSVEADKTLDTSQHDTSAARSRNVSISGAPTSRPRRPALLELGDAIRVQYPDAVARDRLLEERFDALLAKYGKCDTRTIARPEGDAVESAAAADAGETAPEPSATRGSCIHISLPAMRQHNFEKELASLERDLHERGRRIEDMVAARRRAGTHSAGSFLRSLFAGSTSKHREVDSSKHAPVHRHDEPDTQPERGKENKLRKVESTRRFDAAPAGLRPHVSSVHSRSSTTPFGSSATPPSTTSSVLVHHRPSRLMHSDRRSRDHASTAATMVQEVTKRVSNRASLSHSDVRSPTAFNAAAHVHVHAHAPMPVPSSYVSQAQWYAPPEYVNLPLVRPASLALESFSQQQPAAAAPQPAAIASVARAELVEFDREPSIRRSVAPSTCRRAPTAGFALSASNWASSPSVPEYAVIMAPHCEAEMSAAESRTSVSDQSDSATLARGAKSNEDLCPKTATTEHLYENVEVICRSAPFTLQRTALGIAGSATDFGSTRSGQASSTDSSDSELEIPASVKRTAGSRTNSMRNSGLPLESTGTASVIQPISLAPACLAATDEQGTCHRMPQRETSLSASESVAEGNADNDNEHGNPVSTGSVVSDVQTASGFEVEDKTQSGAPSRETVDADNKLLLTEPSDFRLVDRTRDAVDVTEAQPTSNHEPYVCSDARPISRPPASAIQPGIDKDVPPPDAPILSVDARLVHLLPASARVQKSSAAPQAQEGGSPQRNTRVSQLSSKFGRLDVPSASGQPALTTAKSVGCVAESQPVAASDLIRIGAAETRRPSANNVADTEQVRDLDCQGASAFALSGVGVNKPKQTEKDRAQNNEGAPVDIRLRIATFESLTSPPSRSRDSMALRLRDTAV